VEFIFGGLLLGLQLAQLVAKQLYLGVELAHGSRSLLAQLAFKFADSGPQLLGLLGLRTQLINSLLLFESIL